MSVVTDAETTKRKCTMCEGRGDVSGFVGSIGSGAEGYQTDTCPDCNGTGIERSPPTTNLSDMPEVVEDAARAICRAYFYCDLNTPDGNERWERLKDQNRKEAVAALTAIQPHVTALLAAQRDAHAMSGDYCCGISWNGFNLRGDEKSISEVKSLMFYPSRTAAIQNALDEANATIVAQAEAALLAAEALREDVDILSNSVDELQSAVHALVKLNQEANATIGTLRSRLDAIADGTADFEGLFELAIRYKDGPKHLLAFDAVREHQAERKNDP